jgi:hypothetical protein
MRAYLIVNSSIRIYQATRFVRLRCFALSRNLLDYGMLLAWAR